MAATLAFVGAMLAAFQVFQWFGAGIYPAFVPWVRLWASVQRRGSKGKYRRPKTYIVLVGIVTTFLLLLPLLLLGIVGIVLKFIDDWLNFGLKRLMQQDAEAFYGVVKHPRFGWIVDLATPGIHPDADIWTRDNFKKALENPQLRIPSLGLIGIGLVIASYVMTILR